MTLDYQCVTEEAVASSRLIKARQYVTAETLTLLCKRLRGYVLQHEPRKLFF